MRLTGNLCLCITLSMALCRCVPVDRIARHDFESDYYILKTEDKKCKEVYVNYTGDSIIVYPVSGTGTKTLADRRPFVSEKISAIIPGNYFYKSSFIKNTVDVDLSTIILKYRPPMKSVPNQLSANLNAAFYVGFRRNFYNLVPLKTPLGEEGSYIRQVSFDAGFFAGIGITPVNPTVTADNITQEYDGMIFQKGVAAFLTLDNLSVGLALGFDNLLDKNKSVWIYNQKPYIGLVIGISNF